ncbi:unnamed protein product [Adineta ricciae]|uniref:G-protein coupled receptors family 1 profile domain-containing protein n=1 Tax=Adineta ricciae TaxID=249248 RepID=A0A814M8W1_ADIRI|nr:unnamed protein product [Adineta ricciae]CAF1076114.1 unnamed protein product [Adineta ricciae]
MFTNDDLNRCPSIFYGSFANPFFIERILLMIYAIIFVVGVVGNTMTIIIIICNTHLRTPTNFYLLNLAISDLMILMCNLPTEMIEIHYRQWPLPVIFCKLRSICAEFFTCSSILTILAFTCERYFAIVQPSHYHRLSHFRRAQKVILIILFISLVFSVPFGFIYQIETTIHKLSSNSIPIPVSSLEDLTNLQFNQTIFCKSCAQRKSVTHLLSIIIIITSICFFYLPMIIIGAIYLFIVKALRLVNKCENNATTQLNSSLSSLLSASNIGKKQTSTTSCHSLATHKDLTEIKQQNMHLGSYSWLKTRARCQARKVVVKTLVAVVIAFFVCYAPLYVQRLLLAIMNLNLTRIFESDVFANIIAYLYVISGTTYYFGSVVNPILYNVVSNKYRRAFRNLFFCQVTYKSKTTSKAPKTLFQLNRPNKRTVNYLVKKPETFPQLYVQNHYQLPMNGIIPMVKRPAIPTSKSNSSSMSSQNREQYPLYLQHFNESLAKKCQVYQNSRASLRRKLLARKMLADNDR